MDDPLAILDLARDEMRAARESRKVSTRNGGVCVCGHGAGSHSAHSKSGHPLHEVARAKGESVCIPSRVECGCVDYKEVLKASDLRMFRYSTQGPGAQHALAQGISATIAAGKTFTWSEDLECVACRRPASEEVKLAPVAFNKANMSVAYHTTDTNVMICADCKEKIRSRV